MPRGARTAIGDVVGKVATADIMPQQLLLDSTISADPAQAGLAALIPDGYRAISILTNDEIAVGQFVRPGDKVDIQLVLPDDVLSKQRSLERPEGDPSEARTVLQDVLVLTVGATLGDPTLAQAAAEQAAGAAGRRSEPSRTISLAMTPDQIAKFALARSVGSFYLSLRGSDDLQLIDDNTAKLSDIRGPRLAGGRSGAAAAATADRADRRRQDPADLPQDVRRAAMRFVVRMLCVAVLVFVSQIAGAEELRLGVGAQRVINLPAPITRIVVGQGGVIDATALNEDQLQITGLQSGQTTLAVFTARSDQGISYDVTVGGVPAVALPTIPDRGDPQRQIRSQPGLQGVRVNRDGDTLVLSGTVPDLDSHARASSIARAYGGGNVVDLTRVTGNQMVAVDIQFAAVSATTLRALGFNFSALGGSDFQGALIIARTRCRASSSAAAASTITSTVPLASAFNVFLDDPRNGILGILSALSQAGLTQLLAQPTLLVRSGEEASFLAGGEMPIPVPQGGASNGTMTIEYHEYGVRLSIAPVVLSDKRIVLKVSPEVSELDYRQRTDHPGLQRPGLPPPLDHDHGRAGQRPELRPGRPDVQQQLDQREQVSLARRHPDHRRPVQEHQQPAGAAGADHRRDAAAGPPAVAGPDPAAARRRHAQVQPEHRRHDPQRRPGAGSSRPLRADAVGHDVQAHRRHLRHRPRRPADRPAGRRGRDHPLRARAPRRCWSCAARRRPTSS